MVSPLKSLFGRRGNNQGLLAGLPSQANPGTLIRHLLMGADARLGELCARPLSPPGRSNSRPAARAFCTRGLCLGESGPCPNPCFNACEWVMNILAGHPHPHLLMGADARLGELRGSDCLDFCLMPRDAACQYWDLEHAGGHRRAMSGEWAAGRL